MLWAGYAIRVCLIVEELHRNMASAPLASLQVFCLGRTMCLCGAIAILAGVCLEATGY